MDKKSFSFFITGLLIGLLGATGIFTWMLRSQEQSFSNQRQIVLKLGHSLDTDHPVHIAMVYMKERLEEISSQTVTIDIYPGSVLGSEVQCIEQLRSGDLAMTKTSASSIENFVPEMRVYGLPYLFRDEEHNWQVLNGPIGRRLLQKGRDMALYGLCYYDAGSRNFYTVDRPIHSPADLQGLKIRVMNSRTAMEMVKYLGASPVPIAWGELYTALSQGTVDGAENNFPSFTSNKHYEVCKHFSRDAHTRIPDVLLISTLIWDNLPSHVQGWVQQAADESSEHQRELWQQKTKESMDIARDKSVTIYEVDQQLFAEKVQPMYDAIENPVIKDLIQEIREVK